jgi:hypothetical protein
LNINNIHKFLYGWRVAFTRVVGENNAQRHCLATFEEISVNKTKVIFKMIFNSVEECNKIKGFAAEKNEENFDKLEVELRNMS